MSRSELEQDAFWYGEEISRTRPAGGLYDQREVAEAYQTGYLAAVRHFQEQIRQAVSKPLASGGLTTRGAGHLWGEYQNLLN